jgi:thioredoxin-like negative regulator of GroEL
LAKPVVDGLETQLDGKAQLIRLDVLSGVGQQAAARYGVRGVPALVVVDGQGMVVLGQMGIPNSSQVVEQVDSLLTTSQVK